MKAEVKFCATKNGPKAFVNTYDDNWKSSNEPLLAYRKDMRSIRSASPYEEGKDYRVVMSPWVLDDFFQANKIDSVQLVSGASLASPPVGNVRYANEDQLVWYEFSTATTTRRCSDITHAKAFIQEWVNYDCPDLYRYTTNQKDLLVSVWGFALPIFNCALIENRARRCPTRYSTSSRCCPPRRRRSPTACPALRLTGWPSSTRLSSSFVPSAAAATST